MTLSQKNSGGTAARPTRPGTSDAKKGVPARNGFLGMMRPAAAPAGGPATGLSGWQARLSGITLWFRSVLSELRKVTWPSQEMTRNLTIIVIAVSGAVGAFLGGIDYIFKWLVEQLLH